MCTEYDIDTLKSRNINNKDPNYPQHAMYVCQLNWDVDEQNIIKLNDLAPNNQHVLIHAIDCTKDKHTIQLDLTIPQSKAQTGVLIGKLHLAVGAGVMLTVNTSWMLRIDGERKRQGRLRLRVARGQSRGQNASPDTYTCMYYIEKSRQLYD